MSFVLWSYGVWLWIWCGIHLAQFQLWTASVKGVFWRSNICYRSGETKSPVVFSFRIVAKCIKAIENLRVISNKTLPYSSIQNESVSLALYTEHCHSLQKKHLLPLCLVSMWFSRFIVVSCRVYSITEQSARLTPKNVTNTMHYSNNWLHISLDQKPSEFASNSRMPYTRVRLQKMHLSFSWTDMLPSVGTLLTLLTYIPMEILKGS